MKRLHIILIVLLTVLMICLCAVLGIFLTRGRPTWSGSRDFMMVQEKKISAEDIQSLKIDYGRSSHDVLFYQGTGDEIVIREYMNYEPSKKQLSAVEQTGRELMIRGARINQFSFFSSWLRGGYTEIYLPAGFDQGLEEFSVKTVSGEILSQIPWKSQVSQSSFRISTTSGDVWFPEMQAEKIQMSSTSGQIRLDIALAEQIDISTTSGDITVGQAEGRMGLTSTSGEILLSALEGSLQVSTTSGDISLGQVMGNVNLSTTSGSVRLKEGQGDLDAESTSGDIQVGSLKGAFQMSTTSGELSISDGSGFGTAHSVSGDVEIFLAEQTGDVDISTTSGQVELKLPTTAAFQFHFNTTSGECKTFFDEVLSFDSKRRNAQGQYGSGTYSVEVSTASGDLSIRAF